MGTDSSKGEGNNDHTKFGVVYDHLEKIYYFRTEDNQNLQRIRLQDAQLDAGATRGKLDMVENKLPFFHDAASAVVRS